MTGKECTRAVKPPLVQVKQISENLYDVQICENIKQITVKRKDRDTGEMRDVKVYSFTLYAGIVDTRERERFISECIHVRHSIDDEIALMHKYAADKDNAEYATYQDLRAAVKEAAKEYFSEGAA